MTVSFRTSKSVFLGLLNKVAPVIPTSAALPIIQCVKIQVTPDALTLTATKLDNSIIATSEHVQSLDNFNMVVPFKRLKDIVVKADSGDMDISVLETTATITSGAASWQVQLPSGESFPVIPSVSALVDVGIAEFREAFNAVRRFASLDVTRPSLRMIHLANSKMTGCDGIKFTQMSLSDFPADLSLDIPSTSSEFVMNIIKDADSLRIGHSSSHISLQTDTSTLVINKPTSTFPNVEQIMLRPALENKTVLKVDKVELMKALARIKVNADPETEAVGIAIAPTSVTISAKDMVGNQGLETIPASWPSKDRTLVVNCSLLAQLLSVASDDDCCLYLGEDSKSRKSVILLKEESGMVGLIPQMSGNIRIF